MANTLTVQQLNDKFTAAVLDSSNFIKESKNWAGAKGLFKKGARPGEKATLYFDGMGETAVGRKSGTRRSHPSSRSRKGCGS